MLQVQKGLVKYKDRSDIICTYGTTDDGKSYYFLDGEKLNNGNIIASTALVEAIDPLAVASNIGIIDADGKVVVSFENKSIKLVADKVLLIEKSKPTTQSVIDASMARKDPLAATKLVTTSASIKDKMYSKMGSNGRFVFNDQFSEVSICDLDGKNLFGDKSFSFVGINNETLYLSTNTTDSEIVEYYLNGEKEEAKNTNIDINSVVVDPNVVDNAMASEEAGVSNSNVEDTKEFVESDSIIKPVVVEKIEDKIEFPDKGVDLIDNQANEEKQEVINDEIAFKIDDKNALQEEKKMEEIVNIPSNDDVLNKDASDSNFLDSENKIDKFDSSNFDLFKDGIEKDSSFSLNVKPAISREELFSSRIDDIAFNDNNSDDEDSGDTLFEDAADVMSRMISQLEEQRKVMSAYEDKLRKLNDFRKRAFDENKRLVSRYESLYEECKSLRSVVDEQKRIIDNQKEEIQSLKSQVAKKNDFAKLLVRAQTLLEDDFQESKVYSKVI